MHQERIGIIKKIVLLECPKCKFRAEENKFEKRYIDDYEYNKCPDCGYVDWDD